MKDLIIIGAGGFARETAWLVERINAQVKTWNLLGFMDNDKDTIGTSIDGYAVLDEKDYKNKYQDAWYVCAIGSTRVRKDIIDKFENAKFATLIDPGAQISKTVTIGSGSIICAGVIITINVSIGDHVIINLDCTVGHNAALANFVTLYPSVNISGDVEIGECTEVGTGTQIIQMKKVGHDTIIGAGSVVVKDIPDRCTAVGSPAKPIKYRES